MAHQLAAVQPSSAGSAGSANSAGTANNGASAQSAAQQQPLTQYVPNSVAVTNSTGPVLASQTINLEITGIDPKTAPSIQVNVTPGNNGEPQRVEFLFEGTKQVIFNDDGTVMGYTTGRKALYAIEDASVFKSLSAQDKLAAENAVKLFLEAATCLKGSLNSEDLYRAAQDRLEQAVSALHRHGNGAVLEHISSHSPSDDRIAEAKAVVAQRADLELVDTREFDSSPKVLLPNLALGIERMVVKSKAPGADGNVHQAVIETSVFGVDVTQSVYKGTGPDAKPEQVLSARLEKSALDRFNAGDVKSVVEESLALAEALSGDSTHASILPRANPAQGSKSILGSDEGFALARLGALTLAKNVVIAGHGHIHEKVDPRGAKLENLTVADGVFQLEGKLLPGSKITVKAGATLMLDLIKDSDVELIIEPGAKVMQGAAGLGVKDCRVSGEIHGDVTGLELRGVTWVNGPTGKPMTVENFKGMIFDRKKCDDNSVKPFITQSSTYSDVAGLLKVDRTNLSMAELKDLLAEKFVVYNAPDGGFIVAGHEQNRGTHVVEVRPFK